MIARFVLRVVAVIGGLIGLALGSATALGVLLGLEVLRARSSAHNHAGVTVPHASGRYAAGGAAADRADDAGGDEIRLAMLGDSLAVGVGAGRAEDTVGMRVARSLAAHLDRPVSVRSVAVVGAEARHLDAQIDALHDLDDRTDIAIIVIGSNDVLGLTRVRSSCRDLYRAVRRLRAAGSHVIVATCPDLGTLRLLFQPLRSVVGRMSRRMAIAQTRVVVGAGGRAVPLGTTLGAMFWHKPDSMFAADRFHPSPLGYARAAAVIFPSALAAVEGSTADRGSGSRGARRRGSGLAR